MGEKGLKAPFEVIPTCGYLRGVEEVNCRMKEKDRLKFFCFVLGSESGKLAA